MATDRDQEMCGCPQEATSESGHSPRNTLFPVLERSKSAEVLATRALYGQRDQAASELKESRRNQLLFNVKERNYQILIQEYSGQNHVQEINDQSEQDDDTTVQNQSDKPFESGDNMAKFDLDPKDKTITRDCNNNTDFSQTVQEASVGHAESMAHMSLRDSETNSLGPEGTPQPADSESTSPQETLPGLSNSDNPRDLQEQEEKEQQQPNGRKDQVLLMRLKTPPEEGSEAKPLKKTSVGDLVNMRPDLNEVQLKPVAVDGSMYNRWARLPRDEGTDSDETSSQRRPLTLRTLQYSGSLKAVSLVRTIAQTNPIISDPSASAPPPTFKAGMAPAPAFPPSYSTPLPLPESRRPAEVTSSRPITREDQSLLPLSTRVAEYLPFLTSPLRRGESFEEGSERNAVTVLPMRRSTPGNTGASANLQDRLQGACAQRQSLAQALPMSTASLLFSQDVDMRSKRYSYVRKRLHLRPTQNSNNENLPIDGRPTRGPRSASPDGKENGLKQTEVRRVQFIDLAEVKKVLLQKRGSKASNQRCASVLDVVSNRNSYSVSAKSFRNGGGGSYGGGYRHLGRGVRGMSPLQPFIPIGLPVDISSAK